MKQELRRLKELDKIDNYNRNKRMDQYRLQKLIEKDIIHKNKIELMKA